MIHESNLKFHEQIFLKKLKKSRISRAQIYLLSLESLFVKKCSSIEVVEIKFIDLLNYVALTHSVIFVITEKKEN